LWKLSSYPQPIVAYDALKRPFSTVAWYLGWLHAALVRIPSQAKGMEEQELLVQMENLRRDIGRNLQQERMPAVSCPLISNTSVVCGCDWQGSTAPSFYSSSRSFCGHLHSACA